MKLDRFIKKWPQFFLKGKLVVYLIISQRVIVVIKLKAMFDVHVSHKQSCFMKFKYMSNQINCMTEI